MLLLLVHHLCKSFLNAHYKHSVPLLVTLLWSANGKLASFWETGSVEDEILTHVIAAVADASPGSLPHYEQVHLCPSRTGTAQTLSAAIGRLPYLGVPVN